MVEMVAFNGAIADYIERNGITEYGFERQCNLSHGIVRKWRIGEAKPTLTSLSKIAARTSLPVANWVK